MNDETTKRDLNSPGLPAQSASVGTVEAKLAADPTATGMTYASKLPPDHPGLQLERPRPRTLKKGPIILSASVLGLTVGIALLVALTPRQDRSKSPTPMLPDAPSKNVTIAEEVQNAPGNEGDRRQTPRAASAGQNGHRRASGTPQSGNDLEANTRDAIRAAAREERTRALTSPILVDVENPVLADHALAAGAGAAVSPGNKGDDVPSPVGAGVQAAMADPNMQQHKNDFLNRDGANNATYLNQPILTPRSPYEVKAGAIIPTTLITGINSDLPGQIVGQVRENVYDTVTGNYLLIPQGSRLIATYDSAVTFGQARVLVCWNRLVRPDGVSIGLECMPGVDLAGYAGFSDEVDHHWWRIITGVALGTLLSATAQRSQGDISGYTPSMPQLWASNAGGSLNQAGQQITQKNLAIQPTVKVRPGYTVNVLATKDIVLVPYTQEGVTP
jgi:type IV secretion system protein TrbI